MSKPKERSLILHADEVRRVLVEGAVTVCQPMKLTRWHEYVETNINAMGDNWPMWFEDECGEYHRSPCPFGARGDQRWCREAWQSAPGKGYWYKADHPDGIDRIPDGYVSAWKAPRFMPRVASRIDLKLADVGCKQVQDVSEAEAMATGVDIHEPVRGRSAYHVTYRDAFRASWNHLRAKHDRGWVANPWIWVGTFRRVTP